MRVDDLWIDSDSGLGPAGGLRLDLRERLRAGPIAEFTDIEAAIALARLLDEQFRRYGTDATNEIGNEESREALRTLRAPSRPHRRAVRPAIPRFGWLPCLLGFARRVRKLGGTPFDGEGTLRPAP